MFGLDNKGWGLRQMIIYSAIIIVALLIATFYVVALYGQIERNRTYESNNELSNVVNLSDYEISKYNDYESELKIATMYMINNCNCSFDNVITLNELISKGYMNNFRDVRDNSICDGYSVITKNGTFEYNVSSYISCSNYKTEGYSR